MIHGRGGRLRRPWREFWACTACCGASDAKWYAVLGDDVFLDGPNLAAALSAFDPSEEWCLTQCSAMSYGAKRMVEGTYWRIFGARRS